MKGVTSALIEALLSIFLPGAFLYTENPWKRPYQKNKAMIGFQIQEIVKAHKFPRNGGLNNIKIRKVVTTYRVSNLGRNA